jgi:thiosulfate sulfurtransferase
MSYKCLSVDEVKVMIESSVVTLVDIRDALSYRKGNITGSHNITGDNAEEFISTTDKEIPLIIYCYHGNDSKWAADFFSSKGFERVYSMDGGFEKWQEKYLSKNI